MKDNIASHWVFDTPYIFIEGDTLEKTKRIYYVDKNTFLYENTYLIEPKEKCREALNFFMTQKVTKSMLTESKVFIEGKPVNAKYLSPSMPYLPIKLEDLIVNPMPFSVIKDLFERLRASKDKKQKIKYVKTVLNLVKSPLHRYTLFQLILPSLDFQRVFNIKEKSIAKIYIDILNIPKKSQYAAKLLNWEPTYGKLEKGDIFVDSLITLVKLHFDKPIEKLTIYDVNRYLNYLSNAESYEDRRDIMRYLIFRLDPDEQKILINIILKNRSFSSIILSAIHPAATEVYNMTMNLKLLTNIEEMPKDRYPMKLFMPLRPMLAKRVKPENIFKRTSTECLYIETKYDGERVQIHKDKNKIKLLSRKGSDVTKTYSSIIPILVKNIKAKNCILDGELLLWDKEENKPVAFGYMKAYQPSEKTKNLLYVAFDILYFNGNNLIDLPLSSRKSILKNSINEVPHVLEISPFKLACDIEELKEDIEKAMQKKEEGIMVKDPNSKYYPGMRGNEWIKIKPQYIKGIGDNIDVIIIGGYYSLKTTYVRSYLVGIYNDFTKKIVSFSGVGIGFSEEDFKQLNSELDEYWVKKKSNTSVGGVTKVDYGNQVADVYIDPENSRVITITAHQLQITNKYAAGYTLRFPSFVGIRYDKDYKDITTVEEIVQLDEEFGGQNLTKVEEKKVLQAPVKKGKQVAFPFRPADISETKVISNILKGKIFSVLDLEDKHDIEKLIHAHGGKFVQYPNSKTYAVLANTKTFRVKNFMKGYPDMDVVTYDWLKDSIRKKKMLKLEKYKL